MFFFFFLEITVLSLVSSSCVYATRKLKKLQSPVGDCNFEAFYHSIHGRLKTEQSHLIFSKSPPTKAAKCSTCVGLLSRKYSNVASRSFKSTSLDERNIHDSGSAESVELARIFSTARPIRPVPPVTNTTDGVLSPSQFGDMMPFFSITELSFCSRCFYYFSINFKFVI